MDIVAQTAIMDESPSPRKVLWPEGHWPRAPKNSIPSPHGTCVTWGAFLFLLLPLGQAPRPDRAFLFKLGFYFVGRRTLLCGLRYSPYGAGNAAFHNISGPAPNRTHVHFQSLLPSR